MAAGAQRAAAAADSGCWTLTVEEVEAWAASALPRARIVYARGAKLIRTPGVEAVDRLHDEGEVILNWRRVRPGLGEWLATRRAEPEKARPALPGSLRRHASGMARPETLLRRGPVCGTGDEKGQVLVVLKRHANLHRPCPSNREIAAQAGLKSADRAAYLLRLLIGEKAVRIDSDGRTGWRVVTILSTGRKTAAQPMGGEGGK